MARLPIELPEGFSTEVRFHPGYDHRDTPGGSASGLTIAFVLRGPGGGALTWELVTGFRHRPIRDLAWDIYAKRVPTRGDLPGFDHTRQGYDPEFLAGEVALHWPERLAKWWGGPAECNVLYGGKVCYQCVDYSLGDRLIDVLTSEGDNGVWRELVTTYIDWKESATDD